MPAIFGKKHISGFTLIELLIVVAMIGILSTVVLAGYNSFGSRQEVKNEALELKSSIRKAQNFAISGHKNPTQSGFCSDSTLQYYEVTFNARNIEFRIFCENPAANELYDTINIPASFANIVASPCSTVWFGPVNEGTGVCSGDPAQTEMTVTLERDGTRYEIRITNAGEIGSRNPDND